MKDFRQLLRSQFYSLAREGRLLVGILLLLTVFGYVGSLMGVGESLFESENFFGLTPNASMIFGINAGDNSDLALFFVFISVGLFASRDLNDRTVNYEIMNGHDRRHVFLSRALAAILLGAGGGLLMFAAIPLVTTAVYGWGGSIPLGTAAVRILLVLLLFIRISAELVLASMLLRRTYLVYIAGACAYIFESIAFEEGKGSPYVLSCSAGGAIMHFNTFSLEHIDKSSELFFDSTLTLGTAAAIAISYILVTAGCIYFGCRLFCRADID